MVNDPVNHPAYYCDGGIETIDYILAKNMDFLLGQVCKYISRAGKKDPGKELEDLEKAQFYLSRKIQALKGNGHEKQEEDEKMGEDYLDLMTAEEARKLEKISKERYVAERIESAIRRGQSSVYINVAVSGDLKRRLNNLGYGVDVKSTDDTKITWEEMAF